VARAAACRWSGGLPAHAPGDHSGPGDPAAAPPPGALDLLAAPHPTETATRVLDDAAPVAYCLPRGVGSVTVLSRGLLDTLDADALRAITAHERAHVEQRHDLLLLAFRAWRSALPWFPVAAYAEAEVAALIEMLADDVARRDVHDRDLARAILAVGSSGVGGAEPA